MRHETNLLSNDAPTPIPATSGRRVLDIPTGDRQSARGADRAIDVASVARHGQSIDGDPRDKSSGRQGPTPAERLARLEAFSAA